MKTCIRICVGIVLLGGPALAESPTPTSRNAESCATLVRTATHIAGMAGMGQGNRDLMRIVRKAYPGGGVESRILKKMTGSSGNASRGAEDRIEEVLTEYETMTGVSCESVLQSRDAG